MNPSQNKKDQKKGKDKKGITQETVKTNICDNESLGVLEKKDCFNIPLKHFYERLENNKFE